MQATQVMNYIESSTNNILQPTNDLHFCICCTSTVIYNLYQRTYYLVKISKHE